MLPLTYPWIIKKEFGDSKTVLDIASGNGTFIAQINSNHQYEITGVELFDPYIENSKKLGVFKEIIKQDVRNISFPDNLFDVVHASQLVEHLKPEEATRLMEVMEKISSKKVIIGTPNGHYDQDEYDGNELQRHQSAWTYKDFQKRGYKVYGQGLKYIYAENGLLFTPFGKIPVVKYILFAISYLFSPLVYFCPQLAAQIIAVKNK